MRKHNKRFAQRFTRDKKDRSNFPQQMAHKLAHDKSWHFHANALLKGLLAIVLPKKVAA